MPFYNGDDRATRELIPGGTIRSFWGEKTLLSLVDIQPNVEVPSHSHPHEQSGMLLEGELEMGIGTEIKMLRPGDMYIIPGGVEHYAKAYSSSARALDIFTPVRDDYKY